MLFINSNTMQVSKQRLGRGCFPSNKSWNNKTRSYGNQLVRCSIEWFSNDRRKTKIKAITPTNLNRGRQRDEPILSHFVAIIYNSLKAQEKSRVHCANGFGFNSHGLKNWRVLYRPSDRVREWGTAQVGQTCTITHNPWKFAKSRTLRKGLLEILIKIRITIDTDGHVRPVSLCVGSTERKSDRERLRKIHWSVYRRCKMLADGLHRTRTDTTRPSLCRFDWAEVRSREP